MKLHRGMARRFILAGLLISCPIHLWTTGQPPESGPKQKNEEQNSPFTTFMSNHALKIISWELFILCASDEAKKTILEQLKPQNLVANFASQYLTHAMATFIHETGHATAAKLLTNKPVTIHLGAETQKKPLFSCGSININGLNPTVGQTIYTDPEKAAKTEAAQAILTWCAEHHKKFEQLTETEQSQVLCDFIVKQPQKKWYQKPKFASILILLAGGTAAILGHYLIKMLISLGKKIAKPSPTNLPALLTKDFKIDTILCEQLSTMLLPYQTIHGRTNDGKKIWDKCSFIPTPITQAVAKVAPEIDFLAQVYLTQQKDGTSVQTRDAFLVGLINYAWQGYLAFHL